MHSYTPTLPNLYGRIKLLLVMASVAACIYLGLKLGFLLHNDPIPEVFTSGKLTVMAVSVLIFSVVIGTLMAIQSAREGATRVRVRQEAYQNATAGSEARRRRIAELAADPARARYAPLVERGEIWSDAHITYYEAPNLVATCTHLRPIEQAMRAAGIDLRLFKDLEVSAKCHVDFALLKQTLPVASSIHYSEFYGGDPESHERPAAFLICAEHNSMSHTVHPDDSGPMFPLAATRA